MIVKWGRKSLFAGAIAVTFITPVPTPTTNTINEVQHRPSHKIEVRHITPITTVSATGLNRVQIRPDVRLEFRHITPSSIVVPDSKTKTRVYGGETDYDRIIAEDQELLELITIFASIDGF